MIKNIKFNKKLIACALALSIAGTGFGAFKLHEMSEINRVKKYLTDFTTEQNYVDMSRISKDYDIKEFKTKYLIEALESIDVDYIHLNGNIIYDGAHVEPFTIKDSFNHEHLLGYDDNNNPVYEAFDPIKNNDGNGITYYCPEDFELQDVRIYAEPMRTPDIKDSKIVVDDNEDSYAIRLVR